MVVFLQNTPHCIWHLNILPWLKLIYLSGLVFAEKTHAVLRLKSSAPFAR
jgi:hypothetical protein